MRVGVAVQREVARGAPFQDLPAPADPRERANRAQAGPAIVLYDTLRAHVFEAEALSITAEVVEEGAVVFLKRTLGSLRRADLARLDASQRRDFVLDKGRRFPNATPQWEEVSPERVRFTIPSCRLVELVREAGRPELAPLFCQGDARFFGTVEPDVELIRPRTLAYGGACCEFTIQFKAP